MLIVKIVFILFVMFCFLFIAERAPAFTQRFLLKMKTGSPKYLHKGDWEQRF